MEEDKKQEEAHEVVIVGAGIAGLATALALQRVGIKSLVLERSPELRAVGSALHIFPNAWRALEVLGVADKLDRVYHDFQTATARISNMLNGTRREVPVTAANDKGATRMRLIHRKLLLETLAEELHSATIRFSSKLAFIESEIDNDSKSVTVLHMEDGSMIKAKILIGCEGVHSVVARWLGLTAPISSGRSAIRGVGLYPEGHGFRKEHCLFLDHYIKGGFVPISNTEVYWYLSKSSTSQDQEIARDPKLIRKEVVNTTKQFPAEYHDVVSCCDLSTLTLVPLLFRVPWDIILGPTYRGSVTVTGDAFHPMTPDMAQGGCAALEDAVVLARNLANSPNNAAEGIKMYVKERRWRAARLVAASYVAGVLNQCRSGVLESILKHLRGYIFNWLVNSKYGALNFDCGVLPTENQEQRGFLEAKKGV